MPVSATVWSVSHIDGVGNKSEISDILGGIGDGDTIRIWGTEGHTYAGGIIISTPNVVIEQWEGSPPVRPLITATSETPTITTTGNNILIRGLDISDNQNYPERGGGGVYVDGGTLTIENTTITDNTAKYGGGGVYVGGGTLTVENTTITNNDAFFDNGGGGVCI
ncbi:right-handed parallel beta-helix repeat-containing protein [Methanogenium cariaci]|uniref:right-handed parallel beta-helix repeat-containing protein n=1 Tax=Methanogenium cariaci TaxID=2197 RepID=UPI0012F6390B|nr:right-handed parallel beta-helix repeat-containing protein [Methanogenium cariaci]